MTSPLGRIAPTTPARLRVVLDVLVLVLALSWSANQRSGSADVAQLVSLGAAISMAWLVGAVALRHYDPELMRTFADECAMTTVLVMVASTLVAGVSLVAPGTAAPSAGRFLILLWPLALATAPLARYTRASHDPRTDDGVLIIGASSLGAETGEEILRRDGEGSVAGFLTLPGEPPRHALCAPVLGDVTQLQKVLCTVPIAEVYLAAHPARDAVAMQAAVRVCETLGVPFALPAAPFHLERAWPADAHSAPDGYLHYLTIESKPAQMALKRLIDIVVSGLALWMLAPVFAAVAVGIRLSSKGPVFFRQERVGLHGRHFNMLKFRSMVVNAEELKPLLAKQNEQSGPVFKMTRDPRVTAVGRFIRKYSIDELPQLVNVLRGDMSLVGPRPPVPSEVAQYEPWQRRRLSVRPGITCIWQVSGRNQISFEEWMYLDMQYIDHWSLAEDLRLILRTVPVVLSGHGAS